MLTSFEAAAKIGEASQWKVTNLHMQKLLYMTHMVVLGKHHQKLVEEQFESWKLGPVLPSVYHRLKIFGDRPIRNILDCEPSKIQLQPHEQSVMDDIVDALAHKAGWVLVDLTHKEGGGWAKNFNPRFNMPIPDAHILEEYNQYYNDDL